MLVSDGRVLGNAAQQYFLTSGEKTVTFTYNSATGVLTGPLSDWITNISKGYTIPDTTIELGDPAAFTLSHPGVLKGQPVTFTDEGKTTLRPGQ